MTLLRRAIAAYGLLGMASLLPAALPSEAEAHPVSTASTTATTSDTSGVPDAVPEPEELVSCVSWDIKELCCPGYCAAKKGSNWPKADELFDHCIVGIGCKSKHTNGFLSCDCPQ